MSDLLIIIFWDNSRHFAGFQAPSAGTHQRFLFCPLIWAESWMIRGVCPPPPSPPLCWYLYLSPTSSLLSLSPVFVLCSALWSLEMSAFWCPARPVYLFIVLIYFPPSPWYFSLSFPFYWVFFNIIFLLFRGEMFLQACWGFFVWSAVFSALVSFEGTNKLSLHLTYPLSELYTCLTSSADICFISEHIKNHSVLSLMQHCCTIVLILELL